jgi:hemolysin activation/secretion protein
LQWRGGEGFNARVDWGIPLVDVDSDGRTWQENGVYFSVIYNAF